MAVATTTAILGGLAIAGTAFAASEQRSAAEEQAAAIQAGTSSAIGEQRAAREAATSAAEPFAQLGEGIIGELLSSLGLSQDAAGSTPGRISSERTRNAQSERMLELVGAQIVQARGNFDAENPTSRESRTAQRVLGEALDRQNELFSQLGIEPTTQELQQRQENLQSLVDFGPGSQSLSGGGVENNARRLAAAQEELGGLGARIEQSQAPIQQPGQISGPDLNQLTGGQQLQTLPGGTNQLGAPGALPQQLQSQLQTFQPQQAPEAFQANLASPNALFTGGDQDLLGGANQIMDFLRQQGFKEIQDSSAARGRLSSGDTLKDLNRFNIGLASTVLPQLQAQQFGQQLAGQQFQQSQQGQRFGQQLAGQEAGRVGQAQQFGQGATIDEQNRLRQNQFFNQNLAGQTFGQQSQQQRFNQLFNILGLGANAATGQGQAALQAGSNIGNLQVQAGTAAGNVPINQANALSSGIGNLAGLAGLFSGGSSGGSGDFSGAFRPQNQAGPFNALGQF